MNPTKQMIRQLRAENKQWPETLLNVERENWRISKIDSGNRIAALRSRYFLVQVFDESDHIRLSINRTDVDKFGKWIDGITWDELMRVKQEAGYGERLAIEFYPPHRDIVNVANIRHLFIPKTDKLPRHWTRQP